VRFDKEYAQTYFNASVGSVLPKAPPEVAKPPISDGLQLRRQVCLEGIAVVGADLTGELDGPPTSVGLPICDLGTGMWAMQGILAALYERQRTGKGRLVECSLLETAIGFGSWTSAQWLADP
jgi:hypothetical protein